MIVNDENNNLEGFKMSRKEADCANKKHIKLHKSNIHKALDVDENVPVLSILMSLVDIVLNKNKVNRKQEIDVERAKDKNNIQWKTY